MNGSTLMAACCATAAMWLACMPGWESMKRLEPLAAERADHHVDLPPALLLRMIGVAMRCGTSIPAALESVGKAAGGESGSRLACAGRALMRGAGWSEAWRLAALHPEGISRNGSRRDGDTGKRGRGAHAGGGHRASATDRGEGISAMLERVAGVLEASWEHGDAPVGCIDAAVEQMDRDERSDIERHAARLSVRLLMPMGLCFLPSFILIGVLPVIVSFVV